jgi:hypothetical protein
MSRELRDVHVERAPSLSEHFKSSFSGASGCVLVAIDGKGVWVRDSKFPRRRPLFFTEVEWDAFLRGVRNGEFDLNV